LAEKFVQNVNQYLDARLALWCGMMDLKRRTVTREREDRKVVRKTSEWIVFGD
jgi:hypothetical protein